MHLLTNRMRLYTPPKCPWTLNCLDARRLGIMWPRYGSIQDSVAPRLGSVRNAATTAILGLDRQSWISTTLCVSWRRRPNPKALIQVRGDRRRGP